MEKEAFYSGFSQGISAVKINTRGIEEILRSYNPLGRQVNELEDPPETLHTPWGVWLHRWDALHRIEQKYDTEHVLRAAKAADDILHYIDYVPKIGKDEDEIKTHEIRFDYNYLHEEFIYSIGIELEEEDVKTAETTSDTALEEELRQEHVNSYNKHEDVEDDWLENLSVDENSKDASDYIKKNLVEILRMSELKGQTLIPKTEKIS